MNYVIGALRYKLPRAPHPLIRLWLNVNSFCFLYIALLHQGATWDSDFARKINWDVIINFSYTRVK